MDTPGPTGAAAAAAPQRKGRRWPFLVVAILAACALAYVGFFLHYQPLSATGGGTTWVDSSYAKDTGTFTSPRGEEFTQYAVRYADGERLAFMFTLKNGGGLPVTVQSIRLDAPCTDCRYPLEHVSTGLMAHGPNENDPTHAHPFQPFSLAGGDYRNVVVSTRFVHCRDLGRGDIVTFSWVWVKMRTSLIPHEAVIPLGFNLAVSRSDACPS